MRKTQPIYNHHAKENLLRDSTASKLFVLLLCTFINALVPTAAFALSHQTFSRELAKYVENGEVSYDKWRKKPDTLKNYLESLANLNESEYLTLSTEDQKALWLNAYNALTIMLVLDHYPIHGRNPDFPPDSFRQIPDAWEKIQFKVAGRSVTLDEIEHTILRRDFHDPRTHFLTVCASKGSPQLLNHALCGKSLESELERAKSAFLSDEQNISFDTKSHTLKVSKIFEWFPLDFACAEWFKRNKGKLPSEESVIIEYLQKNGDERLRQDLTGVPEAAIHVDYKNFDWSLNNKP